MWTELDKSVRIYRSRQVCENVWRPGGLRLSRSGYLLFVQTVVLILIPLLLPLIHVVSGSLALAFAISTNSKYYKCYFHYYTSTSFTSTSPALGAKVWSAPRWSGCGSLGDTVRLFTRHETKGVIRNGLTQEFSRSTEKSGKVSLKNGPFQSPRPTKESTLTFSYFFIHINFHLG